MTDPNPRPQRTVRVAARVPLGFTAGQRDVVAARLHRRLAELLEDLRLPAIASLEVLPSDEIGADAGQLGLAVDGVPAGVDQRWSMRSGLPQELTQRWSMHGASPEEVAERMAEAAYWNRHLFIPGDDPLARELVARGCSAERATAASGAPGLQDDDAVQRQVDRQVPDRFSLLTGHWLYAYLFEGATSGAERLPRAMADAETRLREQLFFELGVKYPPIAVELDDSLDDFQLRGRFGAIRGPVHEAMLGIELSSISPLARDLRRHAPMFLTRQHMEHALAWLNEAYPLLVFNLVERFRIADVHRVLRELLEEQVSIRDLCAIFEALLAYDGELAIDGVDTVVIAPPEVQLAVFCPAHGEPLPVLAQRCEVVRRALRWQLTDASGGRDGALDAIELAPETEQRILCSAAAPLTAADRQRLCAAIAGAVVASPTVKDVPVLTSPLIRRQVFELIHLEVPGVPVLSRDEIAPGTRPRILHRIDALQEAGRASAS